MHALGQLDKTRKESMLEEREGEEKCLNVLFGFRITKPPLAEIS